MENVLKVLISIFIIGMVVSLIVFFALFGIVPAEKLTQALRGESATSTVATTTPSEPTYIHTTTTVIERERIIERVIEKAPEEPELPPNYENFDITLNEGRFDPYIIRAERGKDVRMSLTSKDTTYTIGIPDLGLSQVVSSGQNKLIVFQALERGEFPITCEGCVEGFSGKVVIE